MNIVLFCLKAQRLCYASLANCDRSDFSQHLFAALASGDVPSRTASGMLRAVMAMTTCVTFLISISLIAAMYSSPWNRSQLFRDSQPSAGGSLMDIPVDNNMS